MTFKPDVLQARSMAAVAAAVALLASMPTAQARVVRMVVDSTTPLAGQAIAYEQVRGRVFGELDPNDPHKAENLERHFPRQFGRLRDIVEGPDKALYLLTSNRDGRGSPAPDDDRIIRLSIKP